MLEIQRAVFEALSAMRETQQRMNGKLSWISRSLPKIYDAVANDVTAAIDDQGERIEALNERLVRLSASSTATVTSNDGVTTPAVGGERREDARARRRGRKTWMIILGRRRHRVAENDQSRSPRR